VEVVLARWGFPCPGEPPKVDSSCWEAGHRGQDHARHYQQLWAHYGNSFLLSRKPGVLVGGMTPDLIDDHF